MKKIFLLLVGAIVAFAANAVPAVPHPVEATQPDGSKIMVKIIGDEFFNYSTTTDGYTIMKNAAGYYVYAVKQNSDLAPSTVIAHNVNARSASEVSFLKGIKKYQISEIKAREGKKMREPVDRATKAARAKASQRNYDNFKGLIVLVQYNDLEFTRGDVQEFYNSMANTQGYTGFTNEDGSQNPYGVCTGSIRDYYYDNSQGRFDPTFDVIGPVTVDYGVNDHQRTSNSRYIWANALQKLNSQVDFSQYDRDGDGNVDMVYFIGAGSGSNSDSDNPNHLWPHKSDLYYQFLTLDGVRFRTYACSTEYVYSASYGILDGIGTICHEFSHVLGLPDLYDTDYEEGGGQSQHPGKWDIMAGGSYQNNSRTPVAYSLYDRYSLGFANAQVINSVGTYSLNEIGSTGEGYIINSPEQDVKFYLENRQKTRWDKYAPGHGMLIVRVDSTNTDAWTSNDVNVNPERNYYVLLRAGNGNDNAQETDCFPAGASFITNTTTPNLLTFDGSPCEYNITSITENNGVITFNVGDDTSLQSVVEDFEMMPVTTSTNEDNVQGVYSKWRFVNCAVQAPGSNYCSGEHSTAMKKPSSLTMVDDVRYVSYMVSFDVYNSVSTAAKFILSYSDDQGQTWKQVSNSAGETTVTVSGNTNTTLSYTFDINKPVRYRISMSAGTTSLKTYIDDFTIYFTDVIPVVETPLATVLGEGVENEEYTIADDLAVIEVAEAPGYAFLTDGNDNWIRVDAGSYFSAIAAINTVAGGTLVGTFTGKDFIPTLTLNSAPEAASTTIDVAVKNYNLASEFAPKVNEVIYVQGYYNEGDNALRAYATYPQGQSASLDLSWITGWVPENGKSYRVRGITQIKEAWTSTAPSPKDYDYDFQNYLIYPVEAYVSTSVENLAIDASDSLVDVYNMQGQVIKQGVIASSAVIGLRPGIYLIGGKKVVVR